MDPYSKPNWLTIFSLGSHACFFYTTPEEFISIVHPFLNEGLTNTRERSLWILPPTLSFIKAKEKLQMGTKVFLEPLLRRRRLVLMPWEKWYGEELVVPDLLKRSRQFLKETLDQGFETLRILSHAPHVNSPYWKEFFLFEEMISRKNANKSVISLCAYSLMDCPVQAISTIAFNHTLCLIPRGAQWEWLTHKQSPSRKAFKSNQLQFTSFHYSKHA